MDIDKSRYFAKKEKSPTHELAATVNLFRDFMGENEFTQMFKTKEEAYKFWLRKCKNITYSDALDLIKSLESLPIQYSKAGTIINKLKNGGRTKAK